MTHGIEVVIHHSELLLRLSHLLVELILFCLFFSVGDEQLFVEQIDIW